MNPKILTVKEAFTQLFPVKDTCLCLVKVKETHWLANKVTQGRAKQN
jgi:hypothetical protein